MESKETKEEINKNQLLNPLKKAADLLYKDYKNNKELTVFSSLDFENFYE